MAAPEGSEHQVAESSDQPNLAFSLKRKDGSIIVSATKIAFSKHQCLYDLVESSREPLGFGASDALKVWYDNSPICLDKMTKLSEIDVKRWLIVTSENRDNDLKEVNKVVKDAMLTTKSNITSPIELDIGSNSTTPDLTTEADNEEIKVDNADYEETETSYEEIDDDELYKNVPLNEIPDKLKKLKNAQMINYKAALIFRYAKFEKYGDDYYNEFIRIANCYNYVNDESRFSFQGDLAQKIPMLIDQLQRIIDHSVDIGQNIQYHSIPFKMNVQGTVEEVSDYKATISVKKIECYNEGGGHPYETYEDDALEEFWGLNSMKLFERYKYTNEIGSCQLQNIPLFLLEKVRITSVQIEDVLNPLNVKWANEEDHQVRMLYHELYVDRPFANLDCLSEEVVIDRLKFRTDVFEKIVIVESNSEDEFGLELQEASGDVKEYVDTQCSANQQFHPFDILINILMKGSLSVQQELFRRLHEQRQSVPILFRFINGPASLYLKNALMFSKVKCQNEFRNISEDKTLPRAVFLSHGSNSGVPVSIEMASQVFSCLFSSKGCELKRFSMMCELTVGFINSKQKQPIKQIQDSLASWMVLHIRGDYTSSISYLKEFRPDIIFVEVDPNDKEIGFKEQLQGIITKHVISWGTSCDSYKYDKSRKLFSGEFHLIADGIKRFLNIVYHFDRDPKIMLKTINEIPSKDNIIDHEDIEININDVIMKLGISNIKEGLILQKSFKKQGEMHRELKFTTDPLEKSKLKSGKSEEERQRSDSAPGHILRQEILKLFCQILLLKNTDLRCVLINSFEAILDRESSSLLEIEKSNISKAYEEYDEICKRDADTSPGIKSSEEKYYAAKRTYVEKSLGLENIWRELIYCYEAAPLDYTILPKLAAEHLLDGFPLELLDGDTGILCEKWTTDLFGILNEKISATIQREPKIFVLSVMGTQSTGKSTMLNIMFGCRMRVSAGQCTKGVYMQLIKSDFENIDYVLILDTEGIRAPEFFGEVWSVWKDNRMTSLDILSADATIITTVNENDIAIREVVPIALLAYKRSQIAFEKAGRCPPMLFFVYSRVETSNLSKFLEIRQSLHKTLQEAEKQVSSFGSQNYTRFLDKFQTSADENKSDIKYFGQLNKGNSPPYDKPDFEFGQKIAIFRQYIDERTNDRNTQTLANWSDHIQLVYECLESVNFELTFKSACEHKAFSEYEERMNTIKQNIGECFTAAFRKIEELIIKEETKHNNTKNIEYFKQLLDDDVQQTVEENDQLVNTILEENKFEAFKENRRQGFQRFLESLRENKYDKIKITYELKFYYDVKKRECQTEISKELKNEFSKHALIMSDEEEQDRLFNKVFDKILKECKQNYPELDVRHKVEEIYNNHQDMAQNENYDKKWLWRIQYSVMRGFQSLYKSIALGNPWSNDILIGALLLLQYEIEVLLQKAKSFDADIVHRIIFITGKTLTEIDIDINIHDREIVTAFIVEDIQQKLIIIQSEFEEDHRKRSERRNETCNNTLQDTMPQKWYNHTKPTKYYDDKKWYTKPKKPSLKNIAKKVQDLYNGKSDEHLKEIFQGLEGEMELILQKAKSFDANIVNSIISITRKGTKTNMDGNDRAKLTVFIREYIIEELTIIQRKWEHKHGITGRLIAEKEIMKKHFENVICKRIFGTDKAKKQISSGLSHALQKGFLEYLARLVQTTIKDKGWVSDSKILEAHVDLEYLIMSKEGKVQQLIQQIKDPQTIYKEIVFKKIDEFVTKDKEREWDHFKTKVLESWRTSCLDASRMRVNGYLKMKEVLKEKLFDQDLGVTVWDHIPEETTWDNELNDILRHKDGSSCNDNFIEIKNEVEEIVKGLCLSDNISVRDYTQQVYTILSEDVCAGARPRCTSVCPRCLLPCSKSLGHYNENDPSSRHDCSHQPTGLVGNHPLLITFWSKIWKSICKWIFNKNYEDLIETSCGEAVAQGKLFVIDGKSIPYTDFDKQYPTWMLPNAIGTSRVRKYLFQVHNKAIAEYYGVTETSSDKFDSPIRESMIDELIEEVMKKTKE